MCTSTTAANLAPIEANARASAAPKRKKAGGDESLNPAIGGGGGLNSMDAQRVASRLSSPIAGISVSPGAIATAYTGAGTNDASFDRRRLYQVSK